MSETSWNERRGFEEGLLEGQWITAEETRRLIEDADAGERSAATLEALEEALKSRFGILLIDATTDDDKDGEIRIELIQAEEEASDQTERLDSIGE